MNTRNFTVRETKKICGVCGGISEYFDIDPTIMRLLWVVFGFASCMTGVIAYLICALVIPERPYDQIPPNANQQP